MTRPRGTSGASEDSDLTGLDQELGSMYDYLAKVILLGPSGTGKSCLLHRFIKHEWRVLSSQTIGVEFATKIVKVGTGPRRKRIKLQLWDTAGTERFRSVSRSYYRGAAGAILVYDLCSHKSFRALQPFLNDARALASPRLSLLLVGNKIDLAEERQHPQTAEEREQELQQLQQSVGSFASESASEPASEPPYQGREVAAVEAIQWASIVAIPAVAETSALSGEGVDEIFARLARMILTKIELGEIDPDDPNSGIQYGDMAGPWTASSDGGSMGDSIRSAATATAPDEGGSARRRRGPAGHNNNPNNNNWGGLREWEDVFTISGARRRGNCC